MIKHPKYGPVFMVNGCNENRRSYCHFRETCDEVGRENLEGGIDHLGVDFVIFHFKTFLNPQDPIRPSPKKPV